jgi:hypothetical protein
MIASAKFVRWLGVLLVVGLLAASPLGALVALAQGGGPSDAIHHAQGWTSIAVGQKVWYAFEYKGNGSQILVRMPASPRSALAFSVWTQAEVDSWARDGKDCPVGRGSPNAAMGNDLVWSGNFNLKGTYYVRVEQQGTAGGSYDLQISGKDVYFPAGSVPVVAAAPAAPPVAQPASVAAPVVLEGTGPHNAMAIGPNWSTVAVGQRVWYAFQYKGNSSQIIIRVTDSPRSSIGFSVWTPGDVDAWARSGKMNPVGRGSPNAAMGNDLVWSGNFNVKGTYYVLVEQRGAVAGNYKIEVSGKGVTF